MFQLPIDIQAHAFTRLPDRFRRVDQTASWLEHHLRGARRHSLLEGPAFDRDGNLYLVDIPYGRVFRVTPSGNWDLVSEYDGEPNGLKIHRDGRIFITDNARGLMQLDPASGTARCVHDGFRHEKFKGLNDLAFGADGSIYFTDQGQTGMHDPSGCLFRLQPTGVLERLLNNIPSPNGVVVSADGSAVYVAVTRANAVWRVPLTTDGQAHKVGVFLQLSGGVGPDGIALMADGGLAVAHVGLGCVWIFDPFGEPLYRVRCNEGRSTTNIAFGGEDFRDLFITEAESGTVLRASLPVAGMKSYSHTSGTAT